MDPNKQAQEVYFSRKTNKGDFQNVSFNESNVEACSSQKYLGLIMDDKLNFDMHIIKAIKLLKLLNGYLSFFNEMPY